METVIRANCISKDFYEKLLENIKEGAEEDVQMLTFLSTLEKLPDCSDIGEKLIEPGKKEGKTIGLLRKQKPRKLSEYQQFMSKCAKKENGKNFSLCVQEWNKLKENNRT